MTVSKSRADPSNIPTVSLKIQPNSKIVPATDINGTLKSVRHLLLLHRVVGRSRGSLCLWALLSSFVPGVMATLRAAENIRARPASDTSLKVCTRVGKTQGETERQRRDMKGPPGPLELRSPRLDLLPFCLSLPEHLSQYISGVSRVRSFSVYLYRKSVTFLVPLSHCLYLLLSLRFRFSLSRSRYSRLS